MLNHTYTPSPSVAASPLKQCACINIQHFVSFAASCCLCLWLWLWLCWRRQSRLLLTPLMLPCCPNVGQLRANCPALADWVVNARPRAREREREERRGVRDGEGELQSLSMLPSVSLNDWRCRWRQRCWQQLDLLGSSSNSSCVIQRNCAHYAYAMYDSLFWGRRRLSNKQQQRRPL